MNLRQPNEDLFENSRMSFGEHLEELRKVLVKSLVAIAIGCVFGFLLANTVVRILNQPLEDAIRQYKLEDASEELLARDGYVAPELLPWLEKEKFIPRRMRIDPAQLVEALQTVVPDFAQKVNLDPYSFKAGHFDLDRLPELCRLMSQQASGDAVVNSRASLVWGLLSPTEQQSIIRIANQTDVAPAGVQQVVDIFNQLARNEKLFDAKEYELEVTEPESEFFGFLKEKDDRPLAKMKAKLEETGDTNISRRLNRALLTGTFTDYMPELKMDLVPVEMWESARIRAAIVGCLRIFPGVVEGGSFNRIDFCRAGCVLLPLVVCGGGSLSSRTKIRPYLFAYQHRVVYQWCFVGVLFRISAGAEFSVLLQSADGNRAANANQRLAEFRDVFAVGIWVGVSASPGNVVYESDWLVSGVGLPGKVANCRDDHFCLGHVSDARGSNQHVAAGVTIDGALFLGHCDVPVDAQESKPVR